MTEQYSDQVISFYDTHPINESEIEAKIAASDHDIDKLTQAELKDFDQDNFGGTDAVDTLAECAGIERNHHVLDVCSGMGGPARWLAHRIGCKVTGIDLTESRVQSARRLTDRVGLTDLVQFVHGDATAMPLPDQTFDALISQEAWAHIPDKSKLISDCSRVLKPEGIVAFTNIVVRNGLTEQEQQRLAKEMTQPEIPSPQDYIELLKANQFIVLRCDDISEQWTNSLIHRLAMYRSLRDTTVARFGEAHFEAWDNTYDFFVSLYRDGKLGGTRIAAQKDA